MTQTEFDALVARLDDKARRNPRAYRLRVLMLALLGYGYLATVLLGVVALLLAALASIVYLKALAIKLILPLGGFLWMVLRAMWVRITPPEGLALEPKEAPALFATIETLRAKLRAPRFHRVLITDDVNAAVVQVPRLGLFGWHRNYLLLGLPLMKSLTPQQFEAVLAHEFGHLSGGDGRVGNWIYRLRMAWLRLRMELQRSSKVGNAVFRPFFNWYVPYFNAYSFPLARSNEYQADATAARLVSPAAMAEALTGVDIASRYVGSRFWPGIHARAAELPQPSITPFSQFSEGLHAGIDAESRDGWLKQALLRETTSEGTHPSLSDRLKAIAQEARVVLPLPGQAADTLLGAALPRVTSALDRHWQEGIQQSWKQRFEEVQKRKQRFAELSEKVEQELSVSEACELADLEEAHGKGADAAMERFRQLRERAPDSALVCWGIGRRLLNRDDDAGVALIEQAMALDNDAIAPCCELLRDYFWRKDQKETAQQWHQRLLERQQLLQEAQAERSRLLLTDHFEPHRLTDEMLTRLQTQLRGIPGLRTVYYVRKRVQRLPESPCYVLGFRITPWWRLHNRKRAAEMQKRILSAIEFPGESFVLNIEGVNRRFAGKLRRAAGARIL